MSQDTDDLTTQPTATALMERIREVEVRLTQEIGTIAARLEDQTTRLEDQTTRLEDQNTRLEGQISSLRDEIVKSFYKLSNRVLTLTEDTLDVRTNQREILKRLDSLEDAVKAS